MPQDKKLSLPDEINTLSALEQVIAELSDLISAARSRRLRVGKKADLEVSTHLANFTNGSATIEEFKALKAQLETVAREARVVRITLSGPPEANFRERLVDWFRQISPNCLVEVLIDPTIIGGAIIRTNRHVYDVSLRVILAQTKPKVIGANAQ